MASVTTDDALALTGKNVGLLKLIKIKSKNSILIIQSYLSTALSIRIVCKAALNIKHFIDPMVSVIHLIRARGLNHR